MDDHHSNENDTSNLIIQGTSIQPGTSSSRPSSARSTTQSKQPITPSREGSAREHRTNITFSSARQRRHSNSSQRSLGLTSPPPDIKQPVTASTSSSIFRVLSPRQNDGEGFFTDQSQQRSIDDQSEETRRWLNDLEQLNSSLVPQQQQNVGPLGMSRDSLNGTLTTINPYLNNNDNQHEQVLSTVQSISSEQVPSEEAEQASIKIQRWYRKNNTSMKQQQPSNELNQFERPSAMETEQQVTMTGRLNSSRPPSANSMSKYRTTPTRSLYMNEQNPMEIILPTDIQQQEVNSSRASSRRPSSSSSVSKHRITPIPSSHTPEHKQIEITSPKENTNGRSSSRRPSSSNSMSKYRTTPTQSVYVDEQNDIERTPTKDNQQQEVNSSRSSSRRPSPANSMSKYRTTPTRSTYVDEQNDIETTPTKDNQQQELNSSRASSRRPSSSASSVSKHRIIPIRSSYTPEHRPAEITSPKETQQQEMNASRSSSRRPSSSSGVSKHRITPVPSPRTDEKIPTGNSLTSSSSKTTLDDVYEKLRQLEEVEQFPIQPPLEDDSVYLMDPTTTVTSPHIIDELFPETYDENETKLTPQDETNKYDLIVESVRSQKSTTRERSSPILTRFTTPPPQSPRRPPSSTKLVQSVTIPQNRASPSIDQQTRLNTKITKPYKSLVVGIYPTTIPRDDEFRTRTNNTEDNFDFRQAIDAGKDLEYQLQKQKDEYEAIIQRHLKFIDQLIDDKKKISSRCELLINELKTIDRKYNDRIRSVDESHQNEIQKLKDTYESAEKIRRERWIEEKTKKIKELTVRGLEPEIQKLISKHKNELAKTKTVHEAELLAADERASQRYIRMVEELRDQLEREKQEAIARERELVRDKYEKSLRDEEKSFNEQRRRLYQEIEEEKNRQADLISRQRADLDKLRRDIEENHRNVVETTKREYEAIRLEQERRHANETNDLKERLNIEKQNWEENYMKKQETTLANKERELRQQMKQERDKEIERIISQFESDTTVTKEEAERTAENRVKRIQEKYEGEIRELENSEKQTREKYNQIRAQLTEVEGERDRLQVLIKQKETEIADIKKITDTLQQERERLSDIIRQEFADRLVLTDDENRRVKNEIAELRARQQLEIEKKKEEIEALKQQQEKELEAIHEKIKQAISKKDEQVQTLRHQYETSVKRAEHLESLLAQQRKLITTKSSAATNASKKT